MSEADNRRILLIDDAPAIHDDFRRLLADGGSAGELAQPESELFGGGSGEAPRRFELHSARQGREGLALVVEALEASRPFAVAFVDQLMPPGWDGVETVERLWEADPWLQVVVCTAYPRNLADRMSQRLALADRLLLLKKPFDPLELRQLAATLCAKWNLSRRAELKTAELEELVRLRSAELQAMNRQLLAAREQAERALRVKSDFLANVSHEIRTPMNTVLGMTHLALQTELAPRQREYLVKARSAADTLMSLFNDLLDLARLQSGRLELERDGFYLEEVLQRVAAQAAEKASLKGLTFLADTALGRGEPLTGDPRRLEQVLGQLCDNAVKFSDCGRVVLRVRTVGEAADRLAVHFSVSDTGVGIGVEELQRLFSPFSQLDASSTRKTGGAGIGLAIAKELVELMGGELGVASSTGRGSEFFFMAEFPCRPGEDAQHSPALPKLAGISASAGLAYCCDNLPLYRDLLQKFLKGRSSAGEEIRGELARGEWQAAARSAHTMTSVAATIGARRLSEAARELELVIGRRLPDLLPPLLDQFDRQLGRVLGSLRALFGDPADRAEPPRCKRVDHQAVRGMLDQMTALFYRDLDRALALKELLHKQLEGSVLAREFARMEREIEMFDFDGALKSRERIDRMLETAKERQ